MRIRSVKPEFWRDDVTGELPPREALFYVGLWCCADDVGRFEWDARLLKADLDPFDQKFGGVAGVEELLGALVALGRVRPYDVEGRRYGWMPAFLKHQHPRKPSIRCPAPPETGASPVPHQCSTGAGEVTPGGEEEGRGEEGDEVRVRTGTGERSWSETRLELERRVRGDVFTRFFGPLTGSVERGALVVVAPDEHLGTFVKDNHLALLEQISGRKVEVRWPFGRGGEA